MRSAEEMQTLIHRVVGLCMKVHRYFGPGRQEKVYENSLVIELRMAGIQAEFQKQLDTFYHGEFVGRDVVDCLIDDELIVEFKVAERIVSAHEVQIVNYLKSSGKETGLLVNFGAASLEFRTKHRAPPNVREEPADYLVTPTSTPLVHLAEI